MQRGANSGGLAMAVVPCVPVDHLTEIPDGLSRGRMLKKVASDANAGRAAVQSCCDHIEKR
mgnify:CR=1 FL=1